MCPKNSLSKSDSGIAPQLTAMSGRRRRALRSWIARANNSFPVPLSPEMSTAASVGATSSTCFITRCSGRLVPTISPKFCVLRISSSRYSFCASSLACSCSSITREVMSTSIVRVNSPPASGLDHHSTQTGRPSSLRRNSSTTPCFSAPPATDCKAERPRCCASGAAARSVFPNVFATSSGSIPSRRTAARFARMKSESIRSYTYGMGASSNRSRKRCSLAASDPLASRSWSLRSRSPAPAPPRHARRAATPSAPLPVRRAAAASLAPTPSACAARDRSRRVCRACSRSMFGAAPRHRSGGPCCRRPTDSSSRGRPCARR